MNNRIIILIFVALVCCTPVFAQGCFDDDTENELLGYFREIHRLQNKAGEDNLDSLYAMNNKFSNFLAYACERNYTIITDLNRLIYDGLDYSVSDDNNCAVFSWEIYSYVGMHYRFGIVFYKSSQGIRSVKYTEGYSPYGITMIYNKQKQPVYLLLWDNSYSLKGRFKRISANVIEKRYGEEGLMPSFIFSDGMKDSTSYLEYKYDLSSYLSPRELPDILISQNRKKISVPIVSEFGDFSGKYNIYNFNGNKFVPEKMSTDNSKTIKGNADRKAN